MMTLPTIDRDRLRQNLVGLLNTPSPTGDTDRAIDFVAGSLAGFPQLQLTRSPKGFLMAHWPGQSSEFGRGLTAHVDTLGAMVAEIKVNGRLKLTQLGGWVWNSVEGEGVSVFNSAGSLIRGTILPTSASIHAHTREKSYETRSQKNMELRLDAHTSSRSETAALGIRVGDIVAFDPRVEVNPNGYIRSRHLDDKASVACMIAAVAALHEAGLTPAVDAYLQFSNYEEVGHGGAAGFPTHMRELVAVDMAVVAPHQQSSERKVTICAKDSGGPYHLGLRRRLEKLAAKHELPYCTDIYPYYGSDGESFWRAGGDVAVGLIGPGVDASHHYERTHMEALVATSQLMCAFLLDPAA